MRKFLNLATILVGIAGFLLALGGIGTQDYCLQFNLPEPEGTFGQVLVGTLLTLPSAALIFVKSLGESR